MPAIQFGVVSVRYLNNAIFMDVNINSWVRSVNHVRHSSWISKLGLRWTGK